MFGNKSVKNIFLPFTVLVKELARIANGNFLKVLSLTFPV